MFNADKIFKSFEKKGEESVRKRLAQGGYHSKIAGLAKEWLRQQEQAREKKYKKSIKWAVWATAIATSIGAILALLALFKNQG